MTKRQTPKQLSAYLVTQSDEASIPVGAVLIDKGNRLVMDWNVMNFETGKTTGAVGRRLARMCLECRVQHNRAGVLGHDGECGTEDVRLETMQVIQDAKKRVESESE